MTKKSTIKIIGYGVNSESDRPFPIFASEKLYYKGKIYKTVQEALEERKKK